MLKTFKSLFLLALFSFVAISCGDDKEETGGVPAVGNVTATIGGTKFEGTNGTGYVTSASNVQILTVGGSKINVTNPTASELVSVVIYSPVSGTIAIGDYDVASESFPKGQITYTVGLAGGTTWVATSGTVTITKITETNFQGTFNGELKHPTTTETKTVTNGGFNVDKSQF